MADDRTKVTRDGDTVIAEAPEAIRGLIEARHVGLLRMQHAGPTSISLVVDLQQMESERLPPPRFQEILGLPLPCLHRVDGAHFAAAILLYLRCSIESAP